MNANGQKFAISDIFLYNSFIVKILEISSLLIYVAKMTYMIGRLAKTCIYTVRHLSGLF